MSKGTLLLIVVICMTAGVYWYMRPAAEIKNYPSQGTDIIAYGDSLVSGFGSSDGKDFVSLLSNKIGQPIVNLGQDGNTTANGVERLIEFNEYKPKVVMVLLGGNDALRKVDAGATFANLRTIVLDLQDRGAVVILLGIRGGIIDSEYPGAFEALSKELHVAYVPDVLDGLFGDKRYMSDGIHPNDAGYAIIAEKVYPVLEPLLK